MFKDSHHACSAFHASCGTKTKWYPRTRRNRRRRPDPGTVPGVPALSTSAELSIGPGCGARGEGGTVAAAAAAASAASPNAAADAAAVAAVAFASSAAAAVVAAVATAAAAADVAAGARATQTTRVINGGQKEVSE